MEKIKINTEYIKLDQFLKWCGAADSGSTAKYMVENGMVSVNGDKVLMRGKKLHPGDIINIKNAESFEITK